MQEKNMLQKIFIFVAALAICVLLVLDAVALLDKFGGERAQQIVGSVGINTASSEPGLAELLENVGKGSTANAASIPFGAYLHEGGEDVFDNAMLVPNLTLNEDGSFAFVENTGSGMGNCSGTAQLSQDGTMLTCSVVTADISCPDQIIFTVNADETLTITTDVHKSVTGSRFVLTPAQ